jgi:hypothetical protein
MDELEAMRARAEAAEQDAARYRWQMANQGPITQRPILDMLEADNHFPHSKELWDAAIDLCIAEQERGNG